jgi:hypothetical protein
LDFVDVIDEYERLFLSCEGGSGPGMLRLCGLKKLRRSRVRGRL